MFTVCSFAAGHQQNNTPQYYVQHQRVRGVMDYARIDATRQITEISVILNDCKARGTYFGFYIAHVDLRVILSDVFKLYVRSLVF